jgi:hypothetical protein
MGYNEMFETLYNVQVCLFKHLSFLCSKNIQNPFLIFLKHTVDSYDL